MSKSALLTPSKGLLWLQPVKQAGFKSSTGFESKLKTSIDRGLFSLSPESFRNCTNRSIIQMVLGRLVLWRYTDLSLSLSFCLFLSLSIFLLFLAIFLIFYHYFIDVSLLEKYPLLLNFLFLLLAVFSCQSPSPFSMESISTAAGTSPNPTGALRFD